MRHSTELVSLRMLIRIKNFQGKNFFCIYEKHKTINLLLLLKEKIIFRWHNFTEYIYICKMLHKKYNIL